MKRVEDWMDLRQLHTFLTVSKLKSFTQAAETIGYAQSTVTTQIQLLESELGEKLFERFGRNVILTPAGENLLPYANQILNLSVEAKTAVNTRQAPKGSIVIGAVESLCISLLPKLLKEYRRRYPGVELLLKMGNCKSFRDQLRKNLIDVAFFLDQKITASDLVIDAQFQEPMVLVASPESPLAEQTIDPKELRNFPFIHTEAGCPYRIMLEQLFNQYGIYPESTYEVESIQAIKQLAVDGAGIALLPRIAVEDELAKKHLTVLHLAGAAFDIYVQVAYHKDKWVSAPLKAFLELVKENVISASRLQDEDAPAQTSLLLSPTRGE